MVVRLLPLSARSGIADTRTDSTTASEVVNYGDIGLTILITHLAARYMRKLQNDAKPGVIYERRKRRQTDPFGLGSRGAGLTVPAPVRLPHARSTSSTELSSTALLPEGQKATPINEYPPTVASSV
jgi:hypothetical protein